MNNFQLYSQYYDLFYQEKETEKECSYVIDSLNQFQVPGNKWLELGAGSGRHGSIFKKQGIDWHGIERSPDMARLAKEKGLDVKIKDIRNFSLKGESFDAILALFHVISYLTDNEDLNSTFKTVHQHLNVGGLFLFDIWYSPAVYSLKPEERTKKVENAELEIVRQATPEIFWNENIVNVNYDIQVKTKHNSQITHFKELHPMRHFSLPELKIIAALNHFDWIHSEEWITQNTPGPNTWGVCCLLKKNS